MELRGVSDKRSNYRGEFFETLRTEFSSEVELLAKIDHRNLVKLLGYLDKGNERLIITEYVPNGTLREHLDGMRNKILDFNQRLEISIDVAHALTYLHLYAEKQIIHRDVKSSNIFLTESMRAKVADFGFARLGSIDSDKTHISTKVKGTVGYLDPEYMRTYQLTPKSDVYSFGILLTEILTGRRPVELKKPPEERVTLRWVFKKFDEGNVRDMVDPLMQEVLDEEILMKMFELAFQCAAPTRNDRPDMKAVGEQLWVIRMDYLRRGRRGSCIGTELDFHLDSRTSRVWPGPGVTSLLWMGNVRISSQGSFFVVGRSRALGGQLYQVNGRGTRVLVPSRCEEPWMTRL
ncbi:calmodulin-binding receptor-like cytoplasmic kinase 3 [Actinidia rufa]|uniref:non-specific serine/threonine protein kinase n=1 Tax=Actinidia rufa TaxID=165716 RepID=A0A7J0DRB2_9ERIC|nr:calmodulin-binding receptor-like cytoplasmic kinase 3 [Actinidia rufa]